MKRKLNQSTLKRLLRDAAFDLDGQAADRRKEARKLAVDGDAFDLRPMLFDDARHLGAIARNARAGRLDRIRLLVRDTDTAVRDLMPPVVLNLAGWHCRTGKGFGSRTCYCAECAVWTFKTPNRIGA